jgi:hypothetical protein
MSFAIRLNCKWWQTNVEIENLLDHWGDETISIGARGGWGGVWKFGVLFVLFTVFSLSSQRVLQIPIVLLNMFPIAPHLYPMCCAQSYSLFTYLDGPKGSHPILQ